MSQDLFVFTKSYQERLDEFKYILNSNIKATDVKREWSIFVEYAIEPAGWRAIWKVSRSVCTSLKIDYPCTVIVTVEIINFKELSCTVHINEVEDGIGCLPSMMTDIPLIELYPTIEQDSNIVLSKLLDTAKVIDSLRFFYNHLWMPWDVDCDETESWVDNHLEGRLYLQFALTDRVVPNELAHKIRKLIVDSRHLLNKIEDMEEAVADVAESEDFPQSVLLLTELHNQMTGLQDQYKIFEKPELLHAYIQRYQSSEKVQQENEKNCESVVYLVVETSTPEQLGKLAKITSEVKLVRIYRTLQETLLKAPAAASVCVTQGLHPVQELANLENGGSIKGTEPDVVLTECRENSKSWNLLSGRLTLTNLTVRMNSVWNILKVRPGAECVLQDVRFEGSTVTDAVDVYPGGKLFANNCHFSNCRVAVVCDTNSTVVLTNCTFTDNRIAIDVKEDCSVTLENCSISGSKEYGINVKVNGQNNDCSLDNVHSAPGFKESGTVFANNEMDRNFEVITKSTSGNEALSASR